MRESFKLEQKLKSQRFSELWLFRSGEFRGRISLGLFGIEENAIKALEEASKKTNIAFKVMPRYETKPSCAYSTNQLRNWEI